MSMESHRGVWIFLEQNHGEMAPVSWELAGAGRRIADKLDTELAGVLLGDNVEDLAKQAFAYGFDKVYLVEDGALKDYRNIPYTKAVSMLVEKYKPEIFLLGATTMGRDLAGAVATEVQTGLTADCTELEVEEDTRLLHAVRPTFGGKLMATIICDVLRPQMATVRPRVMAAPEQQEGRTGEIIREALPMKEEDIVVKVLGYIQENVKTANLDEAEIIVAGGKGIGEAKNFKLVEDLAEVLGGTVAASRAAVDAGWIGHEYQVGQTGVTVRPKIYIAIGISGAIQHLVGMQTSEVIIAINKDPEAPIFKTATYGIVGDLQEIVPALTEELRKRLAGESTTEGVEVASN